MLSPKATHLLLRYFDSIDEALTRRLVRKREWDEVPMTFLLTELMDAESQEDHRLLYRHQELTRDLEATDEPLSLDVRIETHSYPPSMERWVTQSDVGLILSYDDQFDRSASFRSAWLLQAKRLFQARGRYESGYTVNSQFESYDANQHERMKNLRDWAQCDFIRYLLYCPRPSTLERSVREQLTHARTSHVGGEIFDFTLGLELRDDFLSASPTTAAGVFVTLLDSFPDNLLAVHKDIFSGSTPFSWFIVSQFAGTGGIRSMRDRHMREHESRESNINNPIVDGLIRGDVDMIQSDEGLMEVIKDWEHARILPAHTLTVRVISGNDRPRSRNQG